MKKIIAVFAIAAFFTACKTNPGTGEQTNSMASGKGNTPGQHEFRIDGEEPQVIETRGVYDATSRYAASQLHNPNRITISEENDVAETYKSIPVKRSVVVAASNPVHSVNSNNAEVSNTAPAPPNQPVTNGNPVDRNYPNETESTSPEQTLPTTSNNTASTTNNGTSYPVEEESTASTQTSTGKERKEGWSHAAKGTIAGAGSGAVLGAMVSKKHGKGAIIGGILGAGTGYIFGRAKDKKEGRY